ncbi:TolC family protein [Adhaeribacter pallidiroseus]|uniref:Putative efflux pump outer membrane protein SepC n=1 Tax=Adhaeribacter pallidiroseus TaxID=2072847 RepID=A0A369QJ47_9BACT|nr:efflux transporter outer membrane subunit [Adhaeribacter pallidiroseus]RDC64953.1 putative efflux pump outer membrane protein SepC [Adhaeribacter pallidiroseus]
MFKKDILKWVGLAFISLTYTACSVPALVQRNANTIVPASYNNSQDTVNTAKLRWKDFFTDPNLTALIDTALQHNQELNITLQEIQIARNEIRARKGEYMPFVGIKAGAGLDKVARFTNIGAMEANTEIKPEKEMPEPLPDFLIGAYATWEVDIWNKLHNAKRSAISRYLASVEGRNFMITNLISEIANSYFELLALDNQLAIVKQNIEIQSNALQIVKLQKESTRVTELAVRRFQAQVLNTQSLQYDIQQRITETENRINFLVGRYPQPVIRSTQNFENLVPSTIQAGIPAQLLFNRPDIKQAELNLAAAKLDVKVAKARFYPSLGISAGIGYQAFNPTYLLKPESLLYTLAGDLAAPLVNRNAIKSVYITANAQQIQAVYNYERAILNANMEVANQLAKIGNLEKSYSLKSQEVEALTQSVAISNTLFTSARADYMEVLMTQRDALESRFDLVETKMQQMNAVVNIYRALGGGWN